MFWTTIGYTECPIDCTKVLEGTKPVVAPVVQEKIYIRVVVAEPRPTDQVTVAACVEYDGGPCAPVDAKSGFFSIITSEDVE